MKWNILKCGLYLHWNCSAGCFSWHTIWFDFFSIFYLQSYSWKPGATAGFHSKQLGATSDPTRLLCLLIVWNENLHPQQKFEHKIEDLWCRSDQIWQIQLHLIFRGWYESIPKERLTWQTAHFNNQTWACTGT